MESRFDNTNYKSKKTVIFLSVIVIVAAIIFISFSYFTPNITEENNYTTSGSATGGTPNITYTDVTSGINLTGTYPMVDEEGLTLDPYTFNIRNNESESIVYEIYLQTETGNTVPDNLVNFSLDSSAPSTLSTKPEDTPSTGYSHSYKIKTGELGAGANKDFNLQVWFNESGTIATVQNKNWYGKIFVKARFGMLGAGTIKNIVAGEPTNTTDVITKTAPEGATCTNTLAYDGTIDNNLRYVGSNPCNYVTFNGETAGWRIVGVMNNIDDGTGNTETRIKLRKRNRLGSTYSWDTSSSDSSSGWGEMDWTQADLMYELNGDYLDTTLTENTYWYNGQNNQKTAVFDISKRLNSTAQNQISNAKWYLGEHYYDTSTASQFYSYERSTNQTGTARPTTWVGKVALVYPSDFGFAIGGSNRSTCLGMGLSSYNGSNCKGNNYISSSTSKNIFTITTQSYGNNQVFVLRGYLYKLLPAGANEVYPTVYLKSDVEITGGDGSIDNPYTLG